MPGILDDLRSELKLTCYVTVQGKICHVWLCLCWCTTLSWQLWCGL